jgi:hypothetical protein
MITEDRTMSLDDIMELYAGDYPGNIVADILGLMYNRYCYHTGECQDYIEELRDDMIAHGYNGPPIFVDSTFGMLTNGHHRAWAARLAGLDRIPYTPTTH